MEISFLYSMMEFSYSYPDNVPSENDLELKILNLKLLELKELDWCERGFDKSCLKYHPVFYAEEYATSVTLIKSTLHLRAW
jgi:hypothetical protein